ncbi:MAG: hypothetical protein ACRD44_19345 [Bryobacteraceae bacterium]
MTSNPIDDDRLLRELAAEEETAGPHAGSRLKARIYTALVRRQSESGPIENLVATRNAGRALCVFEELVRIAPVGSRAKSAFLCNVCHARLLAESMENPPVWWPHCPYVGFKKP